MLSYGFIPIESNATQTLQHTLLMDSPHVSFGVLAAILYSKRHSSPFLRMSKSLPVRKYIAECLGVFLLTFAVMASPGMITAALTVGVVVYLIGSVSGAHINPAITLGLLSVRKISVKDAILYIVAQVVGAVLAAYLIKSMVEVGGVNAVDGTTVIISEFMGTFVLALGVGSVAFGRVDQTASGVVIGTSLLLGAIIAIGSLGVFNPAVATGAGIYVLSYLLTPLVGGVAGMQMASWIFGKK